MLVILAAWIGASPGILMDAAMADADGISAASTTGDAVTGEYFVEYGVSDTSSIVPAVTTIPESHPVYIYYASYIPDEYKAKLPPQVPLKDGWEPTTRPDPSVG